MNRVTITLTIDLPDGVVPDVAYAPVVEALALMDDPPLPQEPADLFPSRQEAFAPSVTVTSSEPICPIHQKPLTFRPAGVIKSGPKAGQPRGAFWSCGEKDASGRWCSSRQNAA